MPVVSDYTHVNSTFAAGITIDEVVSPASARCANDPSAFCATFNTGGRENSTAILMMQVAGLTFAPTAAKVFVNNDHVGNIQPFRFHDPADRAENADHWYTQYIVFSGTILNDGDNQLRITGVGFDEASGSNQKDQFRVREVVCWFKQSA
jgi:hypothetical protein